MSTIMDETNYTEATRLNGRGMRTPGRREPRQNFSLGPKHPHSPDKIQEQLESLEGLLKQTWTVWGVSSLFNFEIDNELQLKLYAKRLREEAALLLPHDNVTYDAQFSLIDCVTTRPSLDDRPPIKVELFSKANDSGDTSPQMAIYTGIFVSWRTRVTESSCDESTRYPLLLCRAAKSSMIAVHTTICHMFDCIVVALPATEDELTWLVPILLDPNMNENETESGEIRLEYRVPGLTDSSNIIVKFDHSALSKLWKAISDEHDDENEADVTVSVERVSMFHKAIKTQMLEVSGLQLGFFVLYKISLPYFTMTDNRMKATTVSSMNRFLLFFNERALTALHKLDYDTSQNLTTDTL